MNVDRTNLETVIRSTDDFVEDLVDRLRHLQCHSFIATQQSKFMKEIKEGPMDEQILDILQIVIRQLILQRTIHLSFKMRSRAITRLTARLQSILLLCTIAFLLKVMNLLT